MAETNQNQLPAWVWLFTGVITGLFLAFLYYLAGIQIPSEQQPPATTSNSTSRNTPKFDFYTVLPEVEQMANKVKTQANRPEPAAHPINNRYMIQTGSFQSAQDADRRRAQLLLLGLNVKTETVEVRPGQVFHRVQIGPFSNDSQLQAAKHTLNNHNIEHIVLTLK
ncbi:MAG: SPOR domain-containing protein [Gammaproteobacteria bacterium]|nr:MAG: SPOR domain-containing protein [Gammaproteobacteria bacterium]